VRSPTTPPLTSPITSPIGGPYNGVSEYSSRFLASESTTQPIETSTVRTVDRISLVTYLNDHLAASVAALQLLDRLSKSHGQSPLGGTLAEFAWDIRREQRIVGRIVDAFDGGPSLVKRVLASIGEVVSRVKMRKLRSGDFNLQLFEALELLSIGFYGRQSLWRTLERLKRDGILRLDLDFPMHIRGVEQQLVVMRTFRLDIATSALSVAG